MRNSKNSVLGQSGVVGVVNFTRRDLRDAEKEAYISVGQEHMLYSVFLFYLSLSTFAFVSVLSQFWV